jgi:plastocyanin
VLLVVAVGHHAQATGAPADPLRPAIRAHTTTSPAARFPPPRLLTGIFLQASSVPGPERVPKEAALSRSYRRVLLPVLLASLALAACGSSSGGSSAGDTKTAVDGKIDVNAKDPYSFDVKTINATAGPLTVTLHEKGSQTHTFTIPSEKFEIKVTPGNPTATGTVTLQSGKTYDFKCSYDGHAAAGMTGKIVVS